ncbi:hypothetical protein [Paenibacillus dakarensis]|nr:hypothetical protein [Paenibacillus dakarensis]
MGDDMNSPFENECRCLMIQAPGRYRWLPLEQVKQGVFCPMIHE